MKIIISGAYAIGTYLARLLSRNQEEITVIDDDEERLARIGSDYDLLTLHGSPSSVKTLKEANAGDADLFIAVTPDDNENINSCILAHALHARKTVAKIDDSEYMEPGIQQFYKDLGVDELSTRSWVWTSLSILRCSRHATSSTDCACRGSASGGMCTTEHS